jgi:hypothetical protein
MTNTGIRRVVTGYGQTAAQSSIPGGSHITVFTLPPRFDPDSMWGSDDPVERAARFRATVDPSTHPILPAPNPPGCGTARGTSALHATAFVDCLLQVSGESVFVLERDEIRLQPGDWLIMNGVAHSCRNDLDVPALLVGVVIGAIHDGIPLRRVA